MGSSFANKCSLVSLKLELCLTFYLVPSWSVLAGRGSHHIQVSLDGGKASGQGV
jgi:hypothetical protein